MNLPPNDKTKLTKHEFYKEFKEKPQYRAEQRIKKAFTNEDGEKKIKTTEYTNILLGYIEDIKEDKIKIEEIDAEDDIKDENDLYEED